MTTPTVTGESPDDAAAPLDMLLGAAALGIGRRMLPDRSWLKFGAGLIRQPRFALDRGRSLAVELTAIARGTSTRSPDRDKRFADPAWSQNPVLRRTMQTYLAAAETARALLSDVDLEFPHSDRMRFVVDIIVDALSPTNSPLLNPLGYKAAIDTGGASVVRGTANLVRELATPPRVPSMVEADAFTVGVTVAATPGSVVFQSEVLQLIQFTPRTPTVHTAPMLIVPPVINKYYIVDMSPGRSMVEYFLDQGQQVFAISWRNPKADHRAWGFDTYGQAILDAIGAVEQITGAEQTHLFAQCSGGTLATMVTAHLTDIGGAGRVAGLALAVNVLDQSKAGTVMAILDEATADEAIRKSKARGYLDGRSLAEVFAWMRPNDLVWRYWVNNYIEGRKPQPFDVLFWNADTTRMAATLHRDLVLCALNNALTKPGGVQMLGTPVDLSKIAVDTYVVAGIADHISPWQSCYRSARLLSGADVSFVLSSSGHIASLVNPPGNRKASYRLGAPDSIDPQEWLNAAEKHTGSWWPNYTAWLKERSGPDRKAPTAEGNAALPPLMPAPGSYVREK